MTRIFSAPFSIISAMSLVQLLSFQLARIGFEQVLRVQQRDPGGPGIGFGRSLEGFLLHEGDDKY